MIRSRYVIGGTKIDTKSLTKHEIDIFDQFVSSNMSQSVFDCWIAMIHRFGQFWKVPFR